MTRLVINGVEIELYSDVNVAVTKQINDIANLEDRQANYTNKFKVPASANNVSFFENSDQIQSSSTIPYKYNDATVVIDGVPLISRGVAIVDEYDGEDYSVTVYGTLFSFFDAIGEGNLRDLDLSTFNHTFDYSTVMANLIDATPCYAVIDYGLQSKTTRDVDVRQLRPATRVSDMVSAIANYTNYSIGLHPLGMLHIPYSAKEDVYDSAFMIAQQFEAGLITNSVLVNDNWVGVLNTFLNRLFYNNAVNKTIVFDNSIIDPSGLYNVTTGVYTPRYSGYYRFTANNIQIDSTITLPAATHGGFVSATGTVNVKLHLYVNGIFKEQIYVNGFNGVVASINIASATSSYILLNVGDNVELRLVHEVFNYTVIEQFGTQTWEAGSASIEATVSHGNFLNEMKNGFVYGGFVEQAQCLPDMKIKDFLKGICQMCFASIEVDEVTRSVSFRLWSELNTNKANAYDWSSKIDSRFIELSYRLDYAQKNLFQYKEDSVNDNYLLDNSYGNGTLLVNDTTLDTFKEVLTLPFSATASHVTIEDNVVPIISVMELTSGTLASSTAVFTIKSKFNPRIVKHWLFNDTSDKINYTDYDGNSTLMQPLYTFAFIEDRPTTDVLNLGFDNSLIPTYAEVIKRMLDKSKIIQVLVKLTPIEIASFDFFTPVYISQYGAYFYINRINNFINAETLTKVELVRI